MKNLKIGVIESKFDDPLKYTEALRSAKSQIASGSICYLRTPSSAWIRQANELLQRNFDHKKIWFAARAINNEYQIQRKKSIPIKGLKYLPDTAQGDTLILDNGAKMIDFLEHQYDMVNLTKSECSLIQIKTSAQGTQTFDLPDNLRRQTGPNKARKDSYSALVLGNWMVKLYYDIQGVEQKPIYEGFTPTFIK